MLLALLAALIVAAADAWLYTAHFRRRKRAEDPETKQRLIDRELRQRGPTRNVEQEQDALKVLEERAMRATNTETRVAQITTAADAAREDHVDASAIRLRRKPLS